MIEVADGALLTALFGHWPDFHDAELSALRLTSAGFSDPALEADFEVAEMSAEVDERGYYRDRSRARVTLRFERVARMCVEGYWSQNSVSALHLEPAGPEDYDDVLGPEDPRARRRYRVRWGAHVGCSASFLCDAVRVVRAAPVAPAP